MTVKDKTVDGIKVVSLVLNGLTIAGLIISMTVNVQKADSFNINSRRIDGLVIVTDALKDVDKALLQQVTELRGNTTTDIAIINERIQNITKLLEEIKTIVTRR